MSASAAAPVPALAVIGGTVVPALAGGGLGALLALSWSAPSTIDSSFFSFLWKILAGSMIGGIPAACLGLALSWHGAIIGTTTDRAGGAPLWGLVTGAVLGLGIGPVLGGVAAVVFGQLASGVVLGAVLGPLTGILGWEVGYWYADYIRGMRHSDS